MKFDIFGEVRFRFTPTEEQVDLLIELASHHYDQTCRSTAKEIDGHEDSSIGLLPRWKRIIKSYGGEFPTDYQIITATWRQLDLLLKIMEQRSYLHDKGQINKIDELCMDFILAMNAYKEKHGQWEFSVDTSDK
jgi:hypothetical protein